MVRKSNLEIEISKRKTAEKMSYAFGGLSLGSLLVILWMVIRNSKKKKLN
jgi:hypothetical protein